MNDCFGGCGADVTCQQACYDSSSSEAQAAYLAIVACADLFCAPGDVPCILDVCAAEVDACFSQCAPSCAGLACGDDGCGGSCGACGAGEACVAGTCAVDQCFGLTYEGCCAGETLVWCEAGTPQSIECATPSCGWNGSAGYYDCGMSGEEDPSGVHPLSCGP
jgi:hypothetical protein